MAMRVFDTSLKRHHRERAALSPEHERYAYLREEVAQRLIDRLDDVHESYSFAEVVDVGCGSGHVRRALKDRGVSKLREFDLSEAMLRASAASEVEFEVSQAAFLPGSVPPTPSDSFS